jgi:hypothetical protein
VGWSPSGGSARRRPGTGPSSCACRAAPSCSARLASSGQIRPPTGPVRPGEGEGQAHACGAISLRATRLSGSERARIPREARHEKFDGLRGGAAAALRDVLLILVFWFPAMYWAQREPQTDGRERFSTATRAPQRACGPRLSSVCRRMAVSAG